MRHGENTNLEKSLLLKLIAQISGISHIKMCMTLCPKNSPFRLLWKAHTLHRQIKSKWFETDATFYFATSNNKCLVMSWKYSNIGAWSICEGNTIKF